MTDDAPARRRLTLKSAARPQRDESARDPERKRSGARAHRVQRQAAARRPADAPLAPTDTPVADEHFTVFAPCPQGLEAELAQELTALGFDAVRAGRAGCHFETDWSGVMRANLHSRLATRILVRVAHASVRKEDDILALASATPWERWFGPEHRLRVDTSAIRSPMQSLNYCNLRAKDGICDRLRAKEGARPDIDTVRPDARVHLFLDASSATLYLDTSGEALFKRGWRLDKGDAPLRENLAAGLLALSGWTPDQALLDPFCGSGTILLEAAWMALKVPPGVWRPFGFERLRTYRSQHWQDIRSEARSHILEQPPAPLHGFDHNPQAIAMARQNMARARLSENTIHFATGDALEMLPPAPQGHIVTNPPYGERMDDVDAAFWHAWSGQLKRHFGGWMLSIISSDKGLPGALRLKALRRHPVYNGALDCRLFQFALVTSHYRRP